MADAKEKTISLLSSANVSFAANGQTTLFIVPFGKRCILTHVVVVAGADAGVTTISVGQVGALTDFLPVNTLSNLNEQHDVAILQPIPNTTPLKGESYAAGTVLQADVGSFAGGASNTVFLFGFLY
jgi:hypothetical protein